VATITVAGGGEALGVGDGKLVQAARGRARRERRERRRRWEAGDPKGRPEDRGRGNAIWRDCRPSQTEL
jgi:hypothetical protein